MLCRRNNPPDLPTGHRRIARSTLFGSGRLTAMTFFAATACAHNPSPSAEPVAKLLPTCTAAVAVFAHFDSIAAPYDKLRAIALYDRSAAQVVQSLRKKAASAGANGLVLTQVQEPSRSAKLAGLMLAAQTGGRIGGADWMGVAIPVYIPLNAERTRAACGSGAR